MGISWDFRFDIPSAGQVSESNRTARQDSEFPWQSPWPGNPILCTCETLQVPDLPWYVHVLNALGDLRARICPLRLSTSKSGPVGSCWSVKYTGAKYQRYYHAIASNQPPSHGLDQTTKAQRHHLKLSQLWPLFRPWCLGNPVNPPMALWINPYRNMVEIWPFLGILHLCSFLVTNPYIKGCLGIPPKCFKVFRAVEKGIFRGPSADSPAPTSWPAPQQAGATDSGMVAASSWTISRSGREAGSRYPFCGQLRDIFPWKYWLYRLYWSWYQLLRILSKWKSWHVWSQDRRIYIQGRNGGNLHIGWYKYMFLKSTQYQ